MLDNLAWGEDNGGYRRVRAGCCVWEGTLMTPADIGLLVRARRKELGLRQIDLADLTDVSERFVRDLEGGKPSVRLDKMLATCATLGLTVNIAGP